MKRNGILLAALISMLLANTVQAASNPGGSAAPASTKLQGSVKATDVEAAEVLRQMGDALHKMERAGLELMGEATRQDYIAVGDPDVIGTLIIPALPSPSGVMAVGPYLPIREKWMDYYLDQIGKLIPIYAELTDSLVMPPEVKAEATKLLDQMQPIFQDARERYIVLLYYAKHLKDVKNDQIAVLAVRLHDDMDKMDKIRKDVFKLLKQSEK
jgi:hypothetical protein